MAGIWELLRRGLRALTAPAPDPRRTFAAPVQHQRDLLEQVQQARAGLAAAANTLAARRAEAGLCLPALQQQARAAVRSGQDGLARLLLQRRQAVSIGVRVLDDHVREIAQEEQRLALAEALLTAQLAAFRARQDVIAASSSAAEAQVRLNEMLTGLSGELAGLAGVVEQAEERTGAMLARIAAIEQLIGEGVLEQQGLPANGPLAPYLAAERPIEEQLAALRQELEG
jgi:phage shock protein A